MNIMIWVLAGGVAGWIAYSAVKFDENRSLMLSIPVGAVGGFFGGNVLAPMLGATVDAANTFSLFSLVIALASAAGCLAIGNLIYSRFGD